jgi:hypothetical protein
LLDTLRVLAEVPMHHFESRTEHASDCKSRFKYSPLRRRQVRRDFYDRNRQNLPAWPNVMTALIELQ